MTERFGNRRTDQLRQVTITPDFVPSAEGSVLVAFGDTRVICTACVEEGRPAFLAGTTRGWVTAEYAMLPAATRPRSTRDAERGRPSGRSQEIQRLVGRALRMAVDLEALGEHTIRIDCDVLQADGGTRTAAITGAYVALARATHRLVADGRLPRSPMARQVAAVSVGMVGGARLLDLDYREDAGALVDMNVVMDDSLRFIEVQGTAEGEPMSRADLDAMLDLAASGISQLFDIQRESLGD